MKRFISFFLLIILIVCIRGTTALAAGDKTYSETVILSSPDDPYYTLAEEISENEGITIYQTFEDAAEAKPVFLLWVITPENLSESVLMDFSGKLKKLYLSISVGIISGQTIEDARGLWKGSVQIPVNDYAIINGTKENKIKPQIISSGDGQNESMELNMDNIRAVLQSSNTVQISLEGAAGSWFDQSLGITVKSEDIPELDGCIIQNYGCSTFKPWAENSIALACIGKGASAYCGFVYSSVAGTRFGDYTDISTVYTWDEFPLGHLVQLQNHAAMQSYADAPHYFMLGDPRIYCKSEAPYEIISDETSGNTRTIKLDSVESGLIPIYIEDGAGYDFVSVQGLTLSGMDSDYFNSRLQMININADKYIAIDNNSETVTIELRKDAPFIQTAFNNIICFTDSVITQNQGSSQPLLLALPLLILFAISLIRRRYSGRQLIAALIFGTAAALITLCYVLIRDGHITVTNIPAKINRLFITGIFICAGYGELLYAGAKKHKLRIVAVLAANLNTLVSFLIFAAGLLVKQYVAGGAFSINKPSYPWLFTLEELIAGSVLYFALYYLYCKLPVFQRKAKPASEVEET